MDSHIDCMSVCNYCPFLERKGNLLWWAWAVALLGIQFGFLKTNKERKQKGGLKKKWGEERKNKQLRVWILTYIITALKKKEKRKEKDIACGFIICFKIWQKCVNVKAFKILLSTSFLVTGSQQCCQKSVLAGKVRLFSNRKKDLDKKETTECIREKNILEWV